MTDGSNKTIWYYANDETGQWIGPMTRLQLDAEHQNGTFDENTDVINKSMLKQGPMAQGLPYSMISRLGVDFMPSVEDFYNARSDKTVTVLSGPNNSGKTLLLKQLWELVGHDGYLISCNRFSYVDQLNSRVRSPKEHRQFYENFIRQNTMSNQNTENNELQLESIITGLRNAQREKLFKLCEQLIGNQFSIKKTDPENEFSPSYVDMDGENLRYASTGTRLLMTLLGTLLDERFSVILIDEPEISLSPRIQVALARFMYDPSQRLAFCPHLRSIYVATHSHLLLDRRAFSNNFLTVKTDREIAIRPIQSAANFHNLQFNMLGNELESLFLPSAIVLVEGVSDVAFITKLVQLRIPAERKVAIVGVGGEGNMLDRLSFLKNAFGENLEASPYRDRIFVVFDKKHGVTVTRIEGKGIQKNNIVVLSKNGIEYYYPRDIMTNIFHCQDEELGALDLECDPIEYQGFRQSKRELSLLVSDRITAEHQIAPELSDFIDRIGEACK